MRLISLASGTLPEFDPVTVVESAVAAGSGFSLIADLW